MLTGLLLALLVGLAPTTVRAIAGQTIFVKQDAAGANDGTSWDNAYTDLNSALNAAGGGSEIWVAAGVYTPGTSRTDTFNIPPGTAVPTPTSPTQNQAPVQSKSLSGSYGRSNCGDVPSIKWT